MIKITKHLTGKKIKVLSKDQAREMDSEITQMMEAVEQDTKTYLRSRRKYAAC